MYTQNAVRSRYSIDNLETASGPRIVVLCFDRLDRDLAHALAAIDRQDHFETNSTLGHAQDLLSEMATMLDVGAWEHAGALLSVYDYLLRLLACANATKNGPMVRESARLVAELGAAFRAGASVTSEIADATTDGVVATEAMQRFSVRA